MFRSLLRRKFSSVSNQFTLVIIFLFVSTTQIRGNTGDALYFLLQAASPLPSSPSSLLIQSPSFIKVPQGAVLTVHLLQGDKLVATSILEFLQAFESERVVPPVPVASFIRTGTIIEDGSPLPGAKLKSGIADLSGVAIDPSKYRFVWILSSGVMATPGRAIATGSSVGYVDLKLNAVSAASLAGDQKPGSVLFFNRYTSSASNPRFEDTKLNITNTNPASSVFLRIFFVNGATCETDSYGFCLAPQQTADLQVSDIDPGVKGYIAVVATNAQGQPIQFNWLTGNVIIKQMGANLNRLFSTVLSGLAVAKRNEGVVANAGGLAELVFDDVNYDRLPGQIAFDGVPSQASGSNATVISLFSPSANLTGQAANTGVGLTAWGNNDQNQVVTTSGNVSVTCYSDFAVSALRFSPTTVAQLIPSDSTAWISASSSNGQPLLGTMLNSGQFNGAGNGRPLTFVNEYRIRIPVAPVSCGQ